MSENAQAKHENSIRLKSVDSRSAKSVIGYAVLNLVIGVCLYSLTARTVDFFIVNSVFNEQFWGSLFFLTGVGFLVGYLTNSWNLMRFMHLVGLSLKFFWLSAFAARQIENFDSNIFMLIFFATIFYSQFCDYLHFPDNSEAEKWTKAS